MISFDPDPDFLQRLEELRGSEYVEAMKALNSEDVKKAYALEYEYIIEAIKRESKE